MNGTFRYHVDATNGLNKGIQAFLAARSETERQKIRDEHAALIEQDDLLCQFRNDRQRRELIFNPDAEFPVQIQLGMPELDVREMDLRWPRRLRGHESRIGKVTAIFFIALPPRKDCDVLYGCTYHDPGFYGVTAHVSWDNASGGRWRLVLEYRVSDDAPIDDALSRIWGFVENFGEPKGTIRPV